MVIVNMANIRNLKKPIDEMTNAELYPYAFMNGITDDILKKGNKGISIMKQLLDSFNQDSKLRDYALRLRLKKQADYLDRLDLIEEGNQKAKQQRLEGKEEGKEEGKQLGLEQGIQEGKEEGKLVNMIETCKLLMKKSNYTLEEAMDFIEVSQDYKEKIRNEIFKNEFDKNEFDKNEFEK